MHSISKRAAWVEISKENIKFNINNIKDKVGKHTEICGIIKADGYGHGAVQMAKVLEEEGIKSFGVATLEEGISLRENGIEGQILILGITQNEFGNILQQYNLTPVVSYLENAKEFSKWQEEANKEQNKNEDMGIYIAIDTGMGRIGYTSNEENYVEEIKEITNLSKIKVLGIFSHFATADAKDKTYARKQEETFNNIYKELTDARINIPVKTFANSAAIMELESTYYDMVRPGIILYGLYPSEEVDKSNVKLKPVMSVKADIVYLKKVKKGTTIGYGQKFEAKRDSIIGTLPIGYADGYPRAFSKNAKVIVKGKFAPVTGNICMDQCMIDLTDIPDVKIGDEVIIMGSDGNLEISATEIGKETGTINYEIACGFGQRLPKLYI